ncbi:SMP-30/gluconolactonase/LRE family protein [Dietzia cinnamea]|uniref:SMP-30/gluconolactonase/LRE family protein n=1 Tax=Dietzia cinnamea TaxID=321318 RepID=UPI0021A7673A|nr:SMP-30/gluconolactonase/LRE family protein [Dietzia cinnamea]MCT1640518.1 SMP-30/gluconolactonase/LRE family protein [Dietzia cinnamea]
MRVRPLAALLSLATVAALALAPTAAAAPPATGSLDGPPPLCGGWTSRVVASGFGTLENIAALPSGDLLLSEMSVSRPDQGALWRLTPGGTRHLVTPIPGPGGIVVDGNQAYVTFGLSIPSTILNTPTGGITRVDLATGQRTTVATGLVMPNGLAALPGGRLLTTRGAGANDHPTLVEADGTHRPFAPWITSSNGIARDPKSGDLFIGRTLVHPGEVVRVTERGELVQRYPFAGIGPLVGADDLDLAPDGKLYVAQNGGARVVQIDPSSGAQCVVADQQWFASSIAATDANTLYATSFLGTVTEYRRG